MVPAALVAPGADPGSFQGWKMSSLGDARAAFDRPLKAGESFVFDFGEHIVGHPTLSLRAFEIPVAVETVLDRDAPNCVIALGLVLRGATSHADLIIRSVTDGLQQIAIEHRRPVIHEVLLVDDEKQAYARCIGANLNRGREAARAAAAMVEVFHDLERIPSRRQNG